MLPAQSPIVLRVLSLLLEVRGQFSMAGFQEGIVQGEATILTLVEGLSEFYDRCGPVFGVGDGHLRVKRNSFWTQEQIRITTPWLNFSRKAAR
jgi:hypothetical protein